MDPILAFKREGGALLHILLLLLLPFAVLFLYTHITIQTSLLRRELRIARLERDELLKRNDALKDELISLSGEDSTDNLYWKKSGFLPFYVRNKVVTVELDPIDE